MSVQLLAVLGGVASLLALIGYAIYRANTDPFAPPLEREVVLMRRDEADAALMRDEGWLIAPEEDYNRKWSHVWLERWHAKVAPPEPDQQPPNAHKWTDVN